MQCAVAVVGMTHTSSHYFICHLCLEMAKKGTAGTVLYYYSGNPSEDGGVKQDTTALECCTVQ